MMVLDFDDLLVESYNLLNKDPDLREAYQHSYKHILVDEFQDTNSAQMEILKLLFNNNVNGSSFWICRDDWQSIYSFIGGEEPL